MQSCCGRFYVFLVLQPELQFSVDFNRTIVNEGAINYPYAVKNNGKRLKKDTEKEKMKRLPINRQQLQRWIFFRLIQYVTVRCYGFFPYNTK